MLARLRQVVEATSGSTDPRAAIGRRLHPGWSSLADEQEADAFEKFGGNVHTLRQKNVRLRVAIVDAYFAREQDRRSARRERLDLFDQLCPVQTGHDQVGENKIDAALLEAREGVFSIVAGNHTVSTC